MATRSLVKSTLSLSILASLFIAEQVFAEENNQKVTKLETIVVTASGFEQEIKDAPATISVITREDIEKKNPSNIADLLSDVPGVDIRNGVGKTSNLNISMRGMGSAYTLILIDGRRQTTTTDVTPNGFNEASTGFMPPLSAIERIEVIRGPMSTLYGSDAMGGVINIITKKVSDDWTGNVTVSGNLMEDKDEADSWRTSFLLNGPIVTDLLGIQLRGSYLDRQKSERALGTSGRDPRPSEADIYDVGAKLNFKLNDQNNFWIDGFRSNQVYKNQDDRLGTMDTAARAYGYSKSGELEFDRKQIAIGHDGDYSFGQWATYLSQNKTETIGRTIPRNTFPNNVDEGRERTLESTDTVFDTHLIMPIQNHKITVGGEYKNEQMKDDIAGIGAEFKKYSWSLYLEDEWRLLNDLAFTFGGRYENHEGFGSHFSPRGYLVWNANDYFTVKGGVSSGYKSPSAKQLYNGIIGVGGQGTSFSVGSPNLKPEESLNYELGFNFTNLDNLDITTTIFYNKIKDLITSGTAIANCNYTANPNQSGCVSYGSQITEQATFAQSINADEAETKGVEVSLKYSIIPEWDIKAAYTYMETEITKGSNKGQYYTNTPKNAFNTTSTWHLNRNMDLWLQYEFKSSRDRFSETPTSAAGIAELAAIGDKLSGYSLFNLGGSYNIRSNIKANFAINNLLDKDFTENVNYTYLNGSTVTSATAYKYMSTGASISGTYLPGRNYWLSLSYDF